MKVQQLKLEGFRGFDQLTLDFNPNSPTVIIGKNGLGKSSILDALAILLSWFINRVKYNPSSNTRHISRRINLWSAGFSDSHKERDLAKGNFISDSDIKYESKESEQSITIFDRESIFSWEIKTVKDKDTKILDPSQLDNLTKNLRNFLNAESERKETMTIIIHYVINRYIDDIPLEIKDDYSFKPIDAYENALGEKNVNFTSFFQWFRAREDLENEQIRDDNTYKDKQLEAVRNAIYCLIPEFNKLRVRRSPLRITVNKNDQELVIDQLSDGEKCLLAMVGDIARRLGIANPYLDDPLQGEGIVLIDEIELHLHPQWQQKILTQLTKTFPNIQFIVTTHSPIVLSYVKPENIYLLQKSNDGVIAIHPQASYGRDIVEIVEDIMGIPSRNPEIRQQIEQLFQLIEQGDLEAAKKRKAEISQLIKGENDPDLVEASASIKLKEILNS